MRITTDGIGSKKEEPPRRIIPAITLADLEQIIARDVAPMSPAVANEREYEQLRQANRRNAEFWRKR